MNILVLGDATICTEIYAKKTDELNTLEQVCKKIELGGAGYVAKELSNSGHQVSLCSMHSRQKDFKKLCSKEGINIVQWDPAPCMYYVSIYDENDKIITLRKGEKYDISERDYRLIHLLNKYINAADLVVCIDIGNGFFLNENFADTVLTACLKKRKKIFIASNNKHMKSYPCELLFENIQKTTDKNALISIYKKNKKVFKEISNDSQGYFEDGYGLFLTIIKKYASSRSIKAALDCI